MRLYGRAETGGSALSSPSSPAAPSELSPARPASPPGLAGTLPARLPAAVRASSGANSSSASATSCCSAAKRRSAAALQSGRAAWQQHGSNSAHSSFHAGPGSAQSEQRGALLKTKSRETPELGVRQIVQ